MPPAAGHDKVADGFAQARRGLASLQFFRQACRIAWITDGNGCNRLPAFGDSKHLLRGLRIETGHLMNGKAARDCFDGKQRGGGAGIVLGVAIRRLVCRECELADGDGEDGGVFRPSGVELDEHAEDLLEIFRIVAGGDDIRPGLLIVAGRRPAGGFKKAAQDLGGDEGVAKRARAPAVAEQFMNRKFDRRRFLHRLPSCVPEASRVRRSLGVALIGCLERLRRYGACRGVSSAPRGKVLLQAYFAFVLTSSASMVMLTSSPTMTPPPSIGEFHFTPKSWRLIRVVPLSATRSFP